MWEDSAILHSFSFPEFMDELSLYKLIYKEILFKLPESSSNVDIILIVKTT